MIEKRVLLWIAALCICVSAAQSVPLSVYDVQYTADISGNSPYMDQTIDCTGGIVINKWIGGSAKLTIYDPAHADGWGGIIAKAFAGEFDSIQVGDRVSFTDILVEERGGNTQLSFEATSGLSVVSSGNTIPAGAKVTDSVFSEKYESMRVVLDDVQITAVDLGRYGDNYNLRNANGDYWAGDYMNTDVVFGSYHPLVSVGAGFESVSGIIEHKISGAWDYYQLLTTGTGDFVVPEPATVMLVLAGAVFLKRSK